MRIALVGKGGSGKTTLASLLIETLLADQKPVLAIDADINQTLGPVLGLDAPVTRPLGTHQDDLKAYIRGANPRIASIDHIVKTTPPGPGSNWIDLDDRHGLFARYGVKRGDLTLLPVGGFTGDDIGTHCYHAKTGAVELLLNHLRDGANDVVVIDMTAGADAFASGLFTRFDLTLLVVEPTLQSLSVLRQYQDYAADYDLHLRVIGNKIAGPGDDAFIRAAVGSAYIGGLTLSPLVRARDRGERSPFAALEPENRAVLQTAIAGLASIRRDPVTYWRHGIDFHRRNARAWANQATGCDLEQQIDADFLMSLAA